MSYIDQLLARHQQPGPIAALAGSLGQMAGGLGQVHQQAQDRQMKLEDRLREIAGQRAKGLAELGGNAARAGQWEAAAGYANQMPDAVKAAYGIDMPGMPIVGAPVMEAQGKLVAGWRKSEKDGRPGLMFRPPQMDEAPPVRTGMYDTGRRSFDNEQSQAAIRGRLGLETPKPLEVSMGASLYDPNTFERKATAPYPEALTSRWVDDRLSRERNADVRAGVSREGFDVRRDIARETEGGRNSRFYIGENNDMTRFREGETNDMLMFGQREDGVNRRFDTGEGGKNARAAAAAKAKTDAKLAGEFTKRVQGAQLLAEAIKREMPWANVQRVDPSTGDIVLGYPPAAISERARRAIREAHPSAVLLEEPGQPPRLQVIATPDAASLRARAKPPKAPGVIEDKRTGVLVEKKPGAVVSDPQSANARGERTREDKLRTKAFTEASRIVAADNKFRSLPEGQRKAKIYLLADELADKWIREGNGESNQSETQQLIDLMKADKAAKKGPR